MHLVLSALAHLACVVHEYSILEQASTSMLEHKYSLCSYITLYQAHDGNLITSCVGCHTTYDSFIPLGSE